MKSNIPSDFDPSKRHLYKPILFDDLVATTRYHDKKIEGHLTQKAFVTGAAQMLLRCDAEGKKLVRVSIYESGAEKDTVEDMYPEGCKLTIYCPWYKTTQDDFTLIRVDNPADVELEFGSEYYREKGNSLFVAREYSASVDAYTRAIAFPEGQKNHVLYSNRSIAYHFLKRHQEALSDAKKTIEIDATWPKGYVRIAKALMGLKRYEESIQASLYAYTLYYIQVHLLYYLNL
eukprot:gene20011-23982_t